jgi:hypothetical protein
LQAEEEEEEARAMQEVPPPFIGVHTSYKGSPPQPAIPVSPRPAWARGLGPTARFACAAAALPGRAGRATRGRPGASAAHGLAPHTPAQVRRMLGKRAGRARRRWRPRECGREARGVTESKLLLSLQFLLSGDQATIAGPPCRARTQGPTRGSRAFQRSPTVFELSN